MELLHKVELRSRVSQPRTSMFSYMPTAACGRSNPIPKQLSFPTLQHYLLMTASALLMFHRSSAVSEDAELDSAALKKE